MTTSELFKKYCPKDNNINSPTLWDIEPEKFRHLKPEIDLIIDNMIKNQDSNELGFWILAKFRLGFDNHDKERLKKIITEKWHDIHEDIVDYVYEFKDDIFTDDLYQIAIDRDSYRKYDDELESTLRKSVHALKAINSKRSNDRLKALIDTGNENVMYALENYRL
jgi:hypothetical protein